VPVKAKLVEVKWDKKKPEPKPVPNGKVVNVQFNPESLKVSYSNENRGGGQPGGGGGQFVGIGTSKMTVELLFDTTHTGRDVRRLTKDVAFFIEPLDPRKRKGSKQNTSKNRVPPGIRFEWGTFLFSGVAESMEETLDYFSEEGVPLRATVSLSLTRQQVKFDLREGKGLGEGGSAQKTPDIEPIERALKNDSLQRMAGRNDRSDDWKPIAAANNIDNPRRLPPGAPVNLNARPPASARGAASSQASASASASFSGAARGAVSAGASGSSQAGFSAGLGAGTGFGGSPGASDSASAGASASLGTGVGGSFGAEASASLGIGDGFASGIFAGASAQASASATARGSASAFAGFGVSGSTSARARSGVSGRIVSPSSLLDI
jgi:hypothetical protein